MLASLYAAFGFFWPPLLRRRTRTIPTAARAPVISISRGWMVKVFQLNPSAVYRGSMADCPSVSSAPIEAVSAVKISPKMAVTI